MSAQSKHTPGPWSVETVSPFQDEIVSDETVFTIAKMAWCRPNSKLSKANAAFIVRAVNSHADLLAALQNMLDVYLTPRDRTVRMAADKQARAAIVRATQP